MRSIVLFLPLLVATAASAHAQDAEAGKEVFARCMACHNADNSDNKIGPSLLGVVGRTAGTYEGYNYSPAMVDAGENGLVWNEETLTEYLQDPQGMIEGTKMVFPGFNEEEDLQNVIAYLEQVSE